MKQKLMVVLALFFGILAFLLTYFQIQNIKRKVEGASKTVLLVKMKNDLIEDAQIKSGDIEMYQTKRTLDSTGNLEVEWKDRDSILGRKASTHVFKGEILKWFQIEEELSKRKTGLAGIIKYGQRAISISVDTTSSVTGMILPNHYVDIVGTFHFPEMKGDKSLDTITLTLMQRVLILATGTQYYGGPKQKTAKSYNTVTLALTPQEVELIVFASQKGKLILSLRSSEDAMFNDKPQSINFKYMQDNIDDITRQRREMMKKNPNW